MVPCTKSKDVYKGLSIISYIFNREIVSKIELRVCFIQCFEKKKTVGNYPTYCKPVYLDAYRIKEIRYELNSFFYIFFL